MFIAINHRNVQEHVHRNKSQECPWVFRANIKQINNIITVFGGGSIPQYSFLNYTPLHHWSWPRPRIVVCPDRIVPIAEGKPSTCTTLGRLVPPAGTGSVLFMNPESGVS